MAIKGYLWRSGGRGGGTLPRACGAHAAGVSRYGREERRRHPAAGLRRACCRGPHWEIQRASGRRRPPGRSGGAAAAAARSGRAAAARITRTKAARAPRTAPRGKAGPAQHGRRRGRRPLSRNQGHRAQRNGAAGGEWREGRAPARPPARRDPACDGVRGLGGGASAGRAGAARIPAFTRPPRCILARMAHSGRVTIADAAASATQPRPRQRRPAGRTAIFLGLPRRCRPRPRAAGGLQAARAA